MDKPEAVEQVMAAVQQVQEESLRPIPELTAAARPLEDIEGFDSLNCIEAAAKLAAMLGVEIPDSAFIPDTNAPCPSIEQIADKVLNVVNQGSMANV